MPKGSKKFSSQIILALGLLTGLNLLSQNVTLVDSSNMKPIAFAHINYLTSGQQPTGTYTNSFGEATILDLSPNDSVKFSCMGYRSIVLARKYLADTIIMVPQSYELDEVEIILSDQLLTQYLGTDRNAKSSPDRSYVSFKSLILVANPYKSNKLIKDFYFEISRFRTKGKYTVRLIFYKNENGQPGEKINYEKIINIVRKTKREVLVSIEESGLTLPPEGLFVGLERLGCLGSESQRKGCHLATRAIFNYDDIECSVKVFANHDGWADTFIDLNENNEKGFCYLPVYGLVVYE